jgi:SAM-dependent methyltransferase
MLISDLIKFHDALNEKLNSLRLGQSITDTCHELNTILSSNQSVTEFVAHEKIQQAIHQINQLNTQFEGIKNQLSTAVDDIHQQIDLLLPTVNVSSDVPYKKQFKVADNNIYRNFVMSTEISHCVKSRIYQISDWHFSGMQLGCRNAEYTAELVSCDPLYLCDFEQRSIDYVSDQFNDIYNRRLRKYLLADHRLGHLPQNQFGFIFSWMFFNFVDLNELQLYLLELFKTLRPGGVLMFSYNNGDKIESARLFESGMMSFIPKRKLLSVCGDLGFDIIDSFDFSNSDHQIKTISWIELRKPGQLSTIKRSQAQGLIGMK